MTSLLAFCCGTYLVAIAETALASWVNLRGASPSLLALWALICCLARPTAARGAVQPGVIAAAFVGLVFDLNSGGHLGVGVVAFSAVAALLEHFGARVRQLDSLLRTLATAPLVAAMLSLVHLGNLIAGESVPALSRTLWNVATIAAYTSAISLPIWMCVGWIPKKTVGHALRA